tara:strand:+ start:275 stop:481 length:207 start_codon:yes stop_codon:yes gene_type:complete
MEYNIKNNVQGHIVLCEMDNGTIRAMVVLDGFPEPDEALKYVNNMIPKKNKADFELEGNSLTRSFAIH